MSDPTSPAQLARVRESIRDRLTIVIPSFNCPQYLPAAVASALHSPAGRILITDDASGPETLAVARKLEAAHRDRIRVLSSTVRRGTATNMNEAARHVETPYFAKLDGDDVLIPGYMEKVFPIIAANPELAILAGHEQRIAAEEAVEFCPELLPSASRHEPPRIMAGPAAYRFVVAWNPNPCSSGVLYRTDAFRAVGGYDRHMPWGEDWEIWLRFASQWQVGYVHAPSALYRIHQQSATAQAIRHNRLCFGYDAVLRRAAELCAYPDVLPFIRRRMFGVAKLYAGAAIRQFRWPQDSLACGVRAIGALGVALGSRRGATEPAWKLPAIAPARSRN